MSFIATLIFLFPIASSQALFAEGPCPKVPPSNHTVRVGVLIFDIDVIIPFTLKKDSHLFRVQPTFCKMGQLATQLQVDTYDKDHNHCYNVIANLHHQENGVFRAEALPFWNRTIKSEEKKEDKELEMCEAAIDHNETIYIWNFEIARLVLYSCYEINNGHDMAIMVLYSNFLKFKPGLDFLDNYVEKSMINAIYSSSGKVKYCQPGLCLKPTCPEELIRYDYFVMVPVVTVYLGIIFSDLVSLRMLM